MSKLAEETSIRITKNYKHKNKAPSDKHNDYSRVHFEVFDFFASWNISIYK